ncbi:phosphatase PAP2 family protein [Paenibacillus sp. SYP-B4298]|uniref:phosphatase PAP2 family protein n=1 Tax=Paenibacillus sp. SYP-B4298 TaxID=2996034 RepID=UPI0022DE4871|nr:phosphatase PAP2 family protein [Paenibacillus sp. SYP-B4298]
MKLGARLSGALLLSLLCAVAFGWLAYMVGRDAIHSFDLAIIHVIQGWEKPELTRFMEALAVIGSTRPVMLISVTAMLLLGLLLRHRKELILFVFAAGGSALLNVALKNAFVRERPTIYRIVEESGYSFPSGHAMAAFSLYGILAYLLWKHIPAKWGRVLLLAVTTLIICTMGISRIYLGVHYPSDIIGGILASGFWLAVCIGIYTHYTTRRPAKRYS